MNRWTLNTLLFREVNPYCQSPLRIKVFSWSESVLSKLNQLNWIVWSLFVGIDQLKGSNSKHCTYELVRYYE